MFICFAARCAWRVSIASRRSRTLAGPDKEFRGFPIPAAAGLIASLTLFMLWWLGEKEHDIGRWKWVLPPLMLFLSFMMFSRFSYPSFKGLNWRTTRSVPRFLVISVVLIFTALNYEWMPAILFLSYLLYGFVRPGSRKPGGARSRKKGEDDRRDVRAKRRP